jgi:hypothetical protein
MFVHSRAGNLQTLQEIPRQLGIDVRQQMKEFYTHHYSSNVMKLVVSITSSIQLEFFSCFVFLCCDHVSQKNHNIF